MLKIGVFLLDISDLLADYKEDFTGLGSVFPPTNGEAVPDHWKYLFNTSLIEIGKIPEK